jgi:copper resistance protein C
MQMRILIATVSLLLLSIGASIALAHAFLDRASPAVGSTVGAAPHEVSLTFTQNLEGAFSTIQVTGPNGARVDQNKPQVSGNTMRVGIRASQWHVASSPSLSEVGTQADMARTS